MCLHCLQLLLFPSFSLLIHYYQEEIPQLYFALDSMACMLNSNISRGMKDKDEQCFLWWMGWEQHSAEMATGYFTWMSWAIYFSFHWKDHVVVSGCFTEGLKALRSPGVFLSSSHVRIRLMALAVPLAWRSTRMDHPCEHPSSFYMVLAVPAMRMSLWLVVSCSISRSWTGLESKFLKLSLWHLRFMAEPHLLAELRISIKSWNHRTTEQPGLEGTLKSIHFQCPYCGLVAPCQIRASM